MTDLPPGVSELLQQRDQARVAKDFARADELRREIEDAGYLVRDSASGSIAEAKPPFERVDPASITDAIATPATKRFSFHVLHEGFPDDLERFLTGVARHNAVADLEVVVVDNNSSDGEQVHSLTSRFPFARVLHLDREVGWATARNAGLLTSAGQIVVLADLSVEPVGDVCGPLDAVFTDPSVGLAGPYGLVSEDMREWVETRGPEAAAVEGYFLAVRRDLLSQGLIHERFHWYRNADIDLSFQIRSQGTTALVVDIPLVKHTHRGWEAVPEPERTARSRKNHRIFYDRWKDRTDLLVSTS